MVHSIFKVKKRLITFLLLVLSSLFMFQGCSSSGNEADVLNFPSFTGYINDYVNKLDSSSKIGLEELASKIEEDTGSEIAVAIVDNLQGLTEEEYAVELFERWEIGKEKGDNGILILIGIEGEVGKRPLRIEVGYGLEGVITDLEAGNIADEIIIPELQKGDFYTGLYNAIIAIADQIYEEKGLEPISSYFTENASPTTAENESSQTGSVFPLSDSGWIFCFGIPFIMVIAGMLVNLFKKRCPKCKKFKLKTKSTILKKATYASEGKKLVERTCSYCGFYDKKEVTIPKIKKSSSFWTGGSSGSSRSSGGGGFGGFGGGSSGGGGASGKW